MAEGAALRRTAAAPAPGRRTAEKAAPLRPQLAIVSSPRRVRRLTTTLLGALVLFLLAAMFGIAFFHHRLAEGQYELRDLGRRLEDLEYRRGEAEIEVDRLSSPQRIADVAALLGMVIPGEVTDLAVPVS